MMTVQLPLGIRLRDSATFANYLPGPNEEALHHLRHRGVGEVPLYLWGGPGVGKTHLLQAACHSLAGEGAATAYVPLRRHEELSPGFLEGLEALTLVCIDDVQAVAGDLTWEQALFHLYNRVRERRGRLIVAGRQPLAGLVLRMPDLRTRLGWGLVLQLRPLDDAQKALALRQRARGRGMDLGEDVARYLLRHCARDTGELFALLERLDEVSLAARRRLTVPFVKEILERAKD